ncbi:FAD-dependent oxidoreductase [Aquabacterium sp.]|uniref:FAD-dependent oxidoreductase n=1 Tax=Aquabacterium sp. TaxID=1872578 RepID=UPI0025C2221E|nr:FAD-dependent oxidoreductase [Aquabacterium sp.]
MTPSSTSACARIGIAGAGLLGRLLAWQLGRLGHQVTVVDPAPGPAPLFDGQGAAGFTAAGMLSPLAELDAAEPDVAGRGWHSIARWSAISALLADGATATGQDEAPAFTQRGSLMVAHGSDLGAARRVLARVAQPMPGQPAGCSPQALDRPALNALEPSLHGSAGALHAWLLPGEAQIDTVRTLARLQAQAPGVQWRWGETVEDLSPGRWQTRGAEAFDLVIDARGVGARPTWPVRGVRGEVIWLHAPGLGLQRPLRLLHPRHRVYIVPRADDTVLIGASEIESEDRSPVSLRSAVELMAAAHSVLPALAEARILRMDRNLRPALPDHRPRVHHEPGLLRLNGLYRHGWLLAPSVVDEALALMGWPPLPCAATMPTSTPASSPASA